MFTTAEAAAEGVGRHLLSGRCYRSWGVGLWCCTESAPDPPVPDGLHGILPALQGMDRMASHVSAGVLLGLRLPGQLGSTGRIHLTSRSANIPRSRAVVGHRAVLDRRDVWRVGALRVTSPARTLLDLAAMQGRTGHGLLTDEQLIAVVDGVISEHRTGLHAGRPALRRKAELEVDLGRFRGRRGAGRLRHALEASVPGVDSPMETYARIVLEGHGLMGWETDVELRAPGHCALWPDLADRRHRLVLQFDGVVHEDRRQRLRDVERQRATQAAGWTEIRVVHTDLDLGHRADTGAEPRIVSLVRAHRAVSAASGGPRAR